MGALTRADRQRIHDEYLNATGANTFVAEDFVDWLEDKPTHEAYGWFFGKTDAEAAKAWRIGRARAFVSDLRITIRRVELSPEAVKVRVMQAPAVVSHYSARVRPKGGYTAFDPSSAEDQAELQRQAKVMLKGWLGRHESAVLQRHVDAIQNVIDWLQAQEIPRNGEPKPDTKTG
jgi:hypothetical protein